MSCYDINHSLMGLGYVVNDDGTLVLTGMAFNHSFRKVTVPIPQLLFLEGAAAIRKYAEEKVFELFNAQIEEEKRRHEERLARLRAINVVIGTKCEGVYLKGRVTYSRDFIVTLEEPKEYSDEALLHIPRKYGSHHMLTDECTPTLQALTEASEILARMYRQRRKREKYPLAFALLDKLEG